MADIALEFGMQFFPDVAPEQKSAAEYFDESLRLIDFCDPYGWGHVRTVEHYFHHYGGYLPQPLLFLSPASPRTQKAPPVTPPPLPVLHSPPKPAGDVRTPHP